MSKERDMAEADFDLDEDLFNFEEVAGSSSSTDYDLDDIFASFEEAEQAAAEEAATAATPAPSSPEPQAALPSASDTPPAAAPSPVMAPDPAAPASAAAPAPERAGSWPMRPAEPTAVPGAQAAAPAVAVVPASGFGGKGMIWALILIGSLNALVALVVVKSMVAMRSDLVDVGTEVTDSTREVLEDVRRSVDTLSADPLPEVPPSPDEHPTFEAARKEINEGRFLEARQRLYALLAIVDRFDPVTRAEVEARANYLLAEAVHLEAVRTLSEEKR